MLPLQAGVKKRRGLVFWAKILLPLFAVVLVIMVVVWSRIRLKETRIDVQELKLSTPGSVEDATKGEGLKGKNLLYDGVDNRGRAYHVAAADAIAEGRNYRLIKPEGDINLKEEQWAALRSEKGYYWADKKMIDFMENVVLFRNDGMVFETEAASMDIEAGTFAGDQPVKGGNASFEVQSEKGFELLDDGDHVLFHGRSRAKIFGKENEATP